MCYSIIQYSTLHYSVALVYNTALYIAVLHWYTIQHSTLQCCSGIQYSTLHYSVAVVYNTALYITVFDVELLTLRHCRMFTLHYCISQVELLVVYSGSKQLKTCTDQLVHIEKDLKKFQSVYHEVFSR